MKTKLFLLLAIFSIGVVGYGQSQEVPRWTKTFNMGVGLFKNLTYGYGGLSLHTYSPRFLFNDRIRFRFSYDAYRNTNVIIGEYNRLIFEADYLIRLHKMQRYRHALQIYGGGAPIIDFTNAFSKFGIAGRLGVGYTGQLHRFLFSLDNELTFFADGFWVEPIPGISYNILKSLYVKLDMMLPIAFTYSGHSNMGYYMRVGVSILPLSND